MDSLRDYEAFVAVVEKGSLTAAAKSLGRSLQSVSRSLATLEQKLGVTLVQRTTRKSVPTEAGLACYRRLKGGLEQIELAEAEARESAERLNGRLRVSASTLFGAKHVVPVVAAFFQRHTELDVELMLDDDFVDPVAGRFDVAVRIGELPSSSLTARKLAGMRRVAFASPEYLDAHGRPTHPSELVDHSCLVRLAARRPRIWSFGRGAARVEVGIRGAFESNSAQAVNAAAAAGLGVALAPLWQIEDLIAAGAAEIILEQFEPESVPLHALWPAAPVIPAKTRQFVDALVRHCRERIW